MGGFPAWRALMFSLKITSLTPYSLSLSLSYSPMYADGDGEVPCEVTVTLVCEEPTEGVTLPGNTKNQVINYSVTISSCLWKLGR